MLIICEINFCETRANFNFPGEYPALRCSAHSEKDMVNVNMNKCRINGCVKRASYNFSWGYKAHFCKNHSNKDMSKNFRNTPEVIFYNDNHFI